MAWLAIRVLSALNGCIDVAQRGGWIEFMEEAKYACAMNEICMSGHQLEGSSVLFLQADSNGNRQSFVCFIGPRI